jgi:hypothetical protein
MEVAGKNASHLSASAGYDDLHYAKNLRHSLDSAICLIAWFLSPQQALHVLTKHSGLGHAAEDRQRRGETKGVFHFGRIARKNSKEMIVFHETERSAKHAVLKIDGPVHGRDFAEELLPEAKMLRSPVDALPQTYQARGDTGVRDGGFAPMDVSEEMHLDAASQVEA